MLNGIDISGWQSGIDVASVDADFVIVKATGGTSFVNPDFRRQIDQAIASGKLVGCYHFAGDNNPGSWEEEAAHFLSTVSDYVGHAVMVLDWEADATEWPVSWAENWLQRVADSTGSTPWFYSYSSYVNSHDCSSIARFPLWIAAYYAGYEPMGYQDNPPLYGGTGAWSDKVCYQYSSTGDVGGYDGRLDINKFYGSREDFAAFYGGSGNVSIPLNTVAAQLHRIMCDDPRFGYSWAERYGGDEVDTWVIDGIPCTINVGDYECGTSVKTAWAAVLASTPYAGCLEAYENTSNAREVYLSTGLFEIADMTRAQPGDVLLSETYGHIAMYQGNGTLSEFSRSETGGVYGERGDQDGWESHITSVYEYDWIVLHYNGKADPKSTRTEDEPMQFIYRPDGLNELRYHDGTKNVRLSNADQPEAINMVYKRCTGRDIPCFELGTPESPWGARFEQCFPMVTASDEWGGTAR